MVTFVDQRSALFPCELFNFFETVMITGNKSSSGEKLSMFGHAVLFGKGAAIGSNLEWREALYERQALVGVWELAVLKAKNCIIYLEWVLDNVQRNRGAATRSFTEIRLFGVVKVVLLIVRSVVIDFRRKFVRHG